MADNEGIAGSYGAESFGEGIMSAVNSGFDAFKAGATEFAQDVGALYTGTKEVLGDTWDVAADFVEKKAFNTDEDAGISDWKKYQEYQYSSAAMDDKQKAESFKKLVDEGTISDVAKFEANQKEALAKMDTEQKAVNDEVSKKIESFKKRAIEEMKKEQVLSDDLSSPEARRLLIGLDEVAADYATNYGKIVGDVSGKLDKTKWLTEFSKYEDDMLKVMKDWGRNVRDGKSDSEAYDAAITANREAAARVRDFDGFLTVSSLGASTKKYWDELTDGEKNLWQFTKGLYKLGESGLSTAFGAIQEGGLRQGLDFGVMDVNGLEELSHTDNAIWKEAWESIPEMGTFLASAVLMPNKVKALEAVKLFKETGRLSKAGNKLIGETLQDSVWFDPVAQAMMGTGFKDEDFANNLGLNLVFNSGIAMLSKGAHTKVADALADTGVMPDANVFGVTQKEIEALNAGRVTEAMASMTSRQVNGTTEELIDMRNLDQSVRGRVDKVYSDVKSMLESAQNGTAKASDFQFVSSAVLKGDVDAKAASKITSLANSADAVEGALQSGNPKALALYNSLMLNELAKGGVVGINDYADAIRNVSRTSANTEAFRIASKSVMDLATGKKVDEVSAAMRPAVDSYRRDITQNLVNSLVITGKLPAGTRVYGVWQKGADGNYTNVRSGEVVDGPEIVERGYVRGVTQARSEDFDSSLAASAQSAPLKFQEKISGMEPGMVQSVFNDMVSNADFSKIDEKKFAVIKLALKGAVIKDLKNNGLSVDGNFDKHPVFQFWKKEKDGTYVFAVKTSDEERLAKRIALAFETFSPDEFVRKMGGLIRGTETIKDVKKAAKKVKEKAAQSNLGNEGIRVVDDVVDAVEGSLRLPAEQIDSLIADYVDGKLGIGTSKKGKEYDNVVMGWADTTGWTDLNGTKRWAIRVVPNNPNLADDLPEISKAFKLEDVRHIEGAHVRIDDDTIGTRSAIFAWNEVLKSEVEPLLEQKGVRVYVARNAGGTPEWRQVSEFNDDWTKFGSVHTPAFVAIKDGKLMKAWDGQEVFNAANARGSKIISVHKKRKFTEDVYAPVKRLGLKSGKDVKARDLTKDESAGFQKAVDSFMEKHAADVKLRVTTMNEYWSRYKRQTGKDLKQLPGAATWGKKEIMMVDNVEIEKFLHELGHVADGKGIPTELRSTIGKWYEALRKTNSFKETEATYRWKDEGEFFAEFFKDAFIRQRNEITKAIEETGSDADFWKNYENALSFYRTIIERLMEAVAAMFRLDVKFKERQVEIFFDTLVRDMTLGKDFSLSKQVSEKVNSLAFEGEGWMKLVDSLTKTYDVVSSTKINQVASNIPEEFRSPFTGRLLNTALRSEHTKSFSAQYGDLVEFVKESKAAVENLDMALEGNLVTVGVSNKIVQVFGEAIRNDEAFVRLVNTINTMIDVAKVSKHPDAAVDAYVNIFINTDRFGRAANVITEVNAGANPHNAFLNGIEKSLLSLVSDSPQNKVFATQFMKGMRSINRLKRELLEYGTTVDVPPAARQSFDEALWKIETFQKHFGDMMEYWARPEVSYKQAQQRALETFVKEATTVPLNKKAVVDELAKSVGLRKPLVEEAAELNERIDALRNRILDRVGNKGNEKEYDKLIAEYDSVKRRLEGLKKDEASVIPSKTRIIADDVYQGWAVNRAGNRFYGFLPESKVSTVFDFKASVMAPDESIVVSEDVLRQVFRDNTKYGKELARFIRTNPNRVMLTEASVWYDGKQAVTNELGRDELFDLVDDGELELDSQLVDRFADAFEEVDVEFGVAGISGIGGASRMMVSGPLSLAFLRKETEGMIADSDAMTATGSLVLKASDQFREVLQRNKGAFDNTVDADSVVACMSQFGAYGDMARSILASDEFVSALNGKAFKVRDFLIDRKLVDGLDNSGEKYLDAFAAKAVAHRLLVSLSEGEETTRLISSWNSKVTRDSFVRYVGSNLMKNEQLVSIAGEVIRRTYPETSSIRLAQITEALVKDGTMRNFITNVFRTYVAGNGVWDTSYVMSKPDSFTATNTGRHAVTSFEGFGGDYLKEMEGTLREFVEGALGKEKPEGKSKLNVEQTAVLEAGATVEQAGNAEEFVDMLAAAMNKYVDGQVDALKMQDGIAYGEYVGGMSVSTRPAFNWSLYRYSEKGELMFKSVGNELKSASALKLAEDDAFALLRSIDSYGIDFVKELMKKRGAKIEVSPVLKDFFAGNKDVLETIETMNPKNEVQAIKFTAFVASFLRHTDAIPESMKKTLKEKSDEIVTVTDSENGDKWLNMPLFTLSVPNASGKAAEIKYTTANLHLNPVFVSGMKKLFGDEYEKVSRLGAFDSIMAAYEKMLKKFDANSQYLEAMVELEKNPEKANEAIKRLTRSMKIEDSGLIADVENFLVSKGLYEKSDLSVWWDDSVYNPLEVGRALTDTEVLTVPLIERFINDTRKKLDKLQKTEYLIRNRQVTVNAVGTAEEVRPKKKILMNFSYLMNGENMRRDGVISRNTFDAIRLGERTSSTWNRVGIENLRQGDVVEVWSGKSVGEGDKLLVRLTDAPRQIELSKMSKSEIDEWSKAEGWSVESVDKVWKKKLPGKQWNIRFALIDDLSATGKSIRRNVDKTFQESFNKMIADEESFLDELQSEYMNRVGGYRVDVSAHRNIETLRKAAQNQSKKVSDLREDIATLRQTLTDAEIASLETARNTLDASSATSKVRELIRMELAMPTLLRREAFLNAQKNSAEARLARATERARAFPDSKVHQADEGIDDETFEVYVRKKKRIMEESQLLSEGADDVCKLNPA